VEGRAQVGRAVVPERRAAEHDAQRRRRRHKDVEARVAAAAKERVDPLGRPARGGVGKEPDGVGAREDGLVGGGEKGG
jgi:hypothetical protein